MILQMTEDRGQYALSRLNRAPDRRTVLRHAKIWLLSAVLGVLSSGVHAAETTRPVYTPPPPAVSSGNIAQIIFSLLLVLAVIALVAWMLKRMNAVRQGSGNLLKVLGATSVGQRERIVLVEVKDTWLVIGVGPGQIRTLHTLDRPEDFAPDDKPAEKNRFANILSNALGRQNHKQQLAAEVNHVEGRHAP